MDYKLFRVSSLLRLAGITVTVMAMTWCAFHTHWYVTMILVCAALIIQLAMLLQFIDQPAQQVSLFLDAIAFDDPAINFTNLPHSPPFSGLGMAMTRVLDQLRIGRVEREEQAQYLQSIIAHIPVALLSIDESGAVQLMNLAARRLFTNACTEISQLPAYGVSFATDLDSLQPGEAKIVRMERLGGALQLKAAATGLVLRGLRHRLVSLQNIESELSANELAAWQAVIRVMAHEVMNSLTPITSLAGTSNDIVGDVLAQLRPDEFPHAKLVDIQNALETIARRSGGLLHFVHNHRRITKHLIAQPKSVRLARMFARLERLLAAELTNRNIKFSSKVEPADLEVVADAELLDQALINLVRNAIEALREGAAGRIVLSGNLEPSGHVVVAVSDNGPGIPPDQREKVFVPFFTTKRLGSGVGLTLVRQIATLHGATVSISQPPGGGTSVKINF
jgi:nitrogen fixation/metabolism regulation signal transduction histidine kinase